MGASSIILERLGLWGVCIGVALLLIGVALPRFGPYVRWRKRGILQAVERLRAKERDVGLTDAEQRMLKRWEPFTHEACGKETDILAGSQRVPPEPLTSRERAKIVLVAAAFLFVSVLIPGMLAWWGEIPSLSAGKGISRLLFVAYPAITIAAIVVLYQGIRGKRTRITHWVLTRLHGS